MIIQEDSRQQAGKHTLKHEQFAQAGHQIFRSKVIVGDYCKPPAVAVDTKENMNEIAQNIGGSKEEHRRFINELKLAQDLGTELYILVENTDGIEELDAVYKWRNPREEYSSKCILR